MGCGAASQHRASDEAPQVKLEGLTISQLEAIEREPSSPTLVKAEVRARKVSITEGPSACIFYDPQAEASLRGSSRSPSKSSKASSSHPGQVGSRRPSSDGCSSCDGSGRLLPRMSGRQRPPELGACQVSSGGTTEAGVSSVSTGGGTLAQPSPPHSRRNSLGSSRSADMHPEESDSPTVAVDFTAEGLKVLESGKMNMLDLVWTHPTSGAKLFVGAEAAAEDMEILQANSISHIVRCLDTMGGTFRHDSSFSYLVFPIGLWKTVVGRRSDKAIARICAPLLGFVSEALEGGNNVLIHCLAGAHRAGTAAIACLMHQCQLDFFSATAAAQSARSCIDPMMHLKVLLKRLDTAQRTDEIAKAITSAAAKGYQKAVADVFGSRFAE